MTDRDLESRLANVREKLAAARVRLEAAAGEVRMFSALDDRAAAAEAQERYDSERNIEEGLLDRLVKLTGLARARHRP